ncbi:transcriptional regulator [Sulfuricurvum sp.]|uniref:transcriptional regulator n=1 Tax=Sulfuricurvum sp. TaxID=2025608 RepID=UPI002616C23A|nr:transcriptional regulator [Sulfuricurvum sp.]MDD2267435.1 transcriptional regulator [Sulfuricurvum sp.]MDD2782843.1 transcriptional regulator [Sulfuricurvum sp.]
MSEELNLIKKVCRDHSLTYAQLGERIGYGESSIRQSASTGKLSEPLQKAIELYLRTIDLENQVQEYQEFKNFLKKAVQ